MRVGKGSTISPLEDNTVFVIRSHGPLFEFSHKGQLNNLSRQTSINSYQSKTSRLTLDEDLEALKAANMIFIRHVQKTTKPDKKISLTQNKYTILNSGGETLLYAVEIIEKLEPQQDPSVESMIPVPGEENGSGLQFIVVNSQGEEVFDINGNPGVRGFGAHATVRRDSTILGNVAQINTKPSFCPHFKIPTASYLIESADGRTLQKIRAASSCPLSLDDFNVLSPDGSICKAKISRQKDSITLEEYNQTDTYALSFHTTEMDGKLKALLVAAVLMMDFHLTERAMGWKDFKSLIFRSFLAVVLLLLFIALIVVVVQTGIEFQKEKVKKFPGQVPPP